MTKHSKPNYGWIQLKPEFFSNLAIKKLRKLAGGDTYTIILLKLMLLTINTDGCLNFEGIEDTLEDELALVLDEDVDNIKMTLAFIIKVGLAEKNMSGIFIPQVIELTSKRDDSSKRVAEFRKRQKEQQLLLQNQSENDSVTRYSNDTVTNNNGDETQSNASTIYNQQSITYNKQSERESEREQSSPVDKSNNQSKGSDCGFNENREKSKGNARAIATSNNKCPKCNGTMHLIERTKVNEKQEHQPHYWLRWEYCANCKTNSYDNIDEKYKITNHNYKDDSKGYIVGQGRGNGEFKRMGNY